MIVKATNNNGRYQVASFISIKSNWLTIQEELLPKEAIEVPKLHAANHII
jgi:hypothetical protein